MSHIMGYAYVNPHTMSRAENKNYVPVESLLDEGLKLNSIEKMQTLGRKKPAGQRLYFNYLSKLKG